MSKTAIQYSNNVGFCKNRRICDLHPPWRGISADATWGGGGGYEKKGSRKRGKR
jgi:hypothetical protein